MEIMDSSSIINSIKSNKEKFLRFNEIKIRNLHAYDVEEHINGLIEIIPYLLHVNNPDYPGGYAETMPSGIFGYSQSSKASGLMHTLFPTARPSSSTKQKPFIQMLALMGSVGTVAYTNQSDLDFWICYHGEDCDAAALAQFISKCSALEDWIFEKFKVEVHFYLNEISGVKKNIFADDHGAMAGRSLGELLKEEFFRSSIVIAGKIPFWWAVPSDCDDETYKRWLEAAQAADSMNDFIDLGNLYKIKDEEFLVSALFQLLKSLGSPFKSIIKLGLIERYLEHVGDFPFISTMIKKNMQEDRIDVADIDAYIIMFDNVFDYYSAHGDGVEILDLLKKSFYIKVEPKLSQQAGTGETTSKTRMMLEYVKKWNWSHGDIRQMDEFQNWGVEPVNTLLNATKKFVLSGYKRILSRIEANKVAFRFSEQELKGITRKIYSHFLIEENKIDNTLSFKTFPAEKLLKIEYVREKSGNDFWILSKRLIVKDRPHQIIIYKHKNLFGLMVWISLNGLFLKDFTRLEIETGLHAFEPNFLRELIMELSTRFTFKKVKLFDHYFLRDPFPLTSYIIINPHAKYAQKIEEIIFLYHNSWGETRFEVYKNEIDIGRILNKILTGCLMTRLAPDSAVNVVSSSPFRGSREFLWLKNLVKKVTAYFTQSDNYEKKRYLTILGNNYALFISKKIENKLSIDLQFFDKKIKMLYGISANSGYSSSMAVDPSVKELADLKAIAGNYKPDCIQIYFEQGTHYALFYVSDERGSLFFFHKKIEHVFEYLASLYNFSKRLVADIIIHKPSSPLAGQAKNIEIYQLKKESGGDYSLHEVNPEMSTRFIEIQKRNVPCALIIEFNPAGETMYRVLFPDNILSGPFDKHSARDIAEKFRNYMAAMKNYSYFVSVIDLSGVKQALYRDYSSYAFTEKNRFELLIEKEFGMK